MKYDLVADENGLQSYVGDNAYVPSKHLLTPFSGTGRLVTRLDAYKYYLSQVRMRIEMSFGRLVNKFRIFKSPLQCGLKSAPRLFLCATKLGLGLNFANDYID